MFDVLYFDEEARDPEKRRVPDKRVKPRSESRKPEKIERTQDKSKERGDRYE